MVNVRNILFLIFSKALFLGSSNANTCINHDPCLCQLNENEKIDISGLAEDNNLSETNGDTTFTYFGCRDHEFSANKSIKGTLFMSIIKNDNETIYKLGTADTTEFGKLDDQYLITYTNDSNSAYQATIVLLCDSFKYPFLKIIDVKTQKLLLSSPKLCIQKEQHHGMSNGSVFLLVLFITSTVYLLGGALLLYFIRGARGAEMIPNIDFWRNLPGLVKDGLIFLLSGCKPTFVTTAESYDRI